MSYIKGLGERESLGVRAARGGHTSIAVQRPVTASLPDFDKEFRGALRLDSEGQLDFVWDLSGKARG